jgi:hypothetical protein
MTHYSRVTDVTRLGAELKAQVRQLADIALRNIDVPDKKTAIAAEMRTLWLRLLRQHGCTLPEERIDEILAMDVELNAQGLVAWVERQRRAS